MRKILITLFILFLLPMIIAEVCPADNKIDTSIVPCEGITPVIGNCSGGFNFTIFDRNDFSSNFTGNLTIISDSQYNFSFNFTTNSSYLITLCDNSTATVTVGRFKQGYGTSLFAFIIPAVLMSFILLFISGRMNHKMRESEESNEADGESNSRLMPTIFMLFSFIPMIFMVRIVQANITEYVVTSTLINFYRFFYIFFSVIFWFVFVISFLVWLSQYIKNKGFGIKWKEEGI